MGPKTPPLTISSFFFFFLFLFKLSHTLKLTTPLIHHDSTFSPFYNASETTADRASRATRASLARYAFLSLPPSPAPSIETRLVESMYKSGFYVNFTIGSPPVAQLAVMDTGSHFLWVQCLPCTPCEPHKGLVYFEPDKSRTFSGRPCTKRCKRCSSGPWPWSPKYCQYTIDYNGGYHSEGIYATDQLTFETSDIRTAILPKIRFGCSTSLTGTESLDLDFNGVLGLGVGNPNAFLTQFESKFSYCIGRLTDPSYRYNHLAFGDATRSRGRSTPFEIRQFNYYLHLIHICLGARILDIDAKVLRKMTFRKGVVIDSGTTLTYLYTEAFDVVKSEIKEVAALRVPIGEVPAPLDPYELCYGGHVDLEGKLFPTLELQFAGGVSLEIDNTGLFKQVDDETFCLAIVPTESRSYIGILAQQGYNVGFDLKEKELYLDRVDCSVLYK